MSFCSSWSARSYASSRFCFMPCSFFLMAVIVLNAANCAILRCFVRSDHDIPTSPYAASVAIRKWTATTCAWNHVSTCLTWRKTELKCRNLTIILLPRLFAGRVFLPVRRPNSIHNSLQTYETKRLLQHSTFYTSNRDLWLIAGKITSLLTDVAYVISSVATETCTMLNRVNRLSGNEIRTTYAGNRGEGLINYPQHTYTALTFELFQISTQNYCN